MIVHVAPVLEAGAAAVAKKPADILASLKERLAAVREDKAEDASEPAETPPLSDVSAAEKTKQDVLQTALPAVQKAERLNAFAAGYYAKGDLAACFLLLYSLRWALRY